MNRTGRFTAAAGLLLLGSGAAPVAAQPDGGDAGGRGIVGGVVVNPVER